MLVMVVFFIAFRWIHLSTPLIRLFLLVLILLLMPTLNFLPDRKSGSAGMPRPNSYAVFCLKKIIVHSDGYIVTNNHVVENARQLQVILRDQAKAYDARVVGTSPDDDVAVLKVDAQSLPTLSFGDSSALKVGQLAIAIGSPLGQQN